MSKTKTIPRITAIFLIICQLAFAQSDSLAIFYTDPVIEIENGDELPQISENPVKSEIVNPQAIQKFFRKLYRLEHQNDCKLRIVHIGDSHIQADLFTGKMRSLLQNKFGNGGLGFTFPYNLAKTNGNHFVKYSASASFESWRNIYADASKPVGLSGISLQAKQSDFAIGIKVQNPDYYFNSIKIFTPQNKKMFNLATSSANENIEIQTISKTLTHKIKKGETLSGIASKYKMTVAELKKANNMKNNVIKAGFSLKIPSSETTTVTTFVKSSFTPLELQQNEWYYSYNSDYPLDRIYAVPADYSSDIALNGFVLENDKSGVVYSSIGVNGAKASDYNKFPLFFNQLAGLEADLVVISLGTNESFDKQDTATYFSQLQLLIANIKIHNPNVEILVTTPPPSFFKGKIPNTIVAGYTTEILTNAKDNKVAVWDMFSALGGLYPSSSGILAKDKVHYSRMGYELQGDLFFNALITNYNKFKATQFE